MVYTVTFNPAIDYIARLDELHLGETNRTADEVFHPGGKGINVSIMLHRLGVSSQAVAFTGGFTGATIESMVRDTGITADFIPCSGITRINVKIKEKRETEINGKGVNISQAELERLYQKLDTLKDGDWLVLAGSVPSGMPLDTYAQIMRRLDGKKVKVVVDATGELLKLTLPYHPFLVKPNVQELGEVFGVTVKSDEEIVGYAKKLTTLGAENVIVSMSGKGAIMVTAQNEVYRCLPPQGKVIDSVGAGDSLVAGFIAGYLQSGDYLKAFHTGIASGSATAFSVWLADKALVDELIKQIK